MRRMRRRGGAARTVGEEVANATSAASAVGETILDAADDTTAAAEVVVHGSDASCGDGGEGEAKAETRVEMQGVRESW